MFPKTNCIVFKDGVSNIDNIDLSNYSFTTAMSNNATYTVNHMTDFKIDIIPDQSIYLNLYIRPEPGIIRDWIKIKEFREYHSQETKLSILGGRIVGLPSSSAKSCLETIKGIKEDAEHLDIAASQFTSMLHQICPQERYVLLLSKERFSVGVTLKTMGTT